MGIWNLTQNIQKTNCFNQNPIFLSIRLALFDSSTKKQIMSDSDENDSKSTLNTSAESTLPTLTATADSDDSGAEDSDAMGIILRYFQQTLNVGTAAENESSVVEKVIPELTFEGLSSHWREHGFKNIITMVGAGISTSAGIPDFRSPGSGLYNNLKKYKLPTPTAIFEMNYFKRNPKPFFELAKELYPGSFVPTPAHYFVRLLHEKGLLQRHYTQNIDTLDRLAGLPDEKIIEAHGSFHTNHCLKCNEEYDMAWMKEKIFADKLPSCDRCQGIVKPDIVFFGENLPYSFYSSPDEDFKECDLLIIMGTSLEVQPFASLIKRAGPRCIRLLINRDAVGRSSFASWVGGNEPSLLYGKSINIRDVAYLGDCDAGVMALAEALGWESELLELINSGKEQHAKQNNDNVKKNNEATEKPANVEAKVSIEQNVK